MLFPYCSKLTNGLRWGAVAVALLLGGWLSPGLAANEVTDRAVALVGQVSGQAAYRIAEELSADAYQGRRSGTPGGDAAADRVVSLMQAAGLTRVRKDPFSFPYFEVHNLEVTSSIAGLATDQVVVAFGSGDTPPGSYLIVSAGYASAGECERAAEQAAGEPWVALIRYGTASSGPVTPFLGQMENARKAGASAVLFFACPGWAKWPDAFFAYKPNSLASRLPSDNPPSIGVLTVSSTAGTAALQALGLPSTEPGGSVPVGFRTRAHVRLAVDTDYGLRTAYNVIGEVPGVTEPERQTLVGAHYDHVGQGRFTLYATPPAGSDLIYNGADDNASGVAAMLEAARVLAGSRPARSLWFVAFGAEEEGLLGSKELLNRYPSLRFSLDSALILDMVGASARPSAYRKVQLHLEDMPSGRSSLVDLVLEVSRALVQAGDIAVGEGAAGGVDDIQRAAFQGGSDHEPLAHAGIPATLFIVEGEPYPWYHRVEDEADKLDARKLEVSSRLAAASAYVAAARSLRQVPPRAPGDLSGDSRVTTKDAVLCLYLVAGITPRMGDDLRVADVAPVRADGAHGDGRITLEDVVAMLRLSLGLEP